MLKIRIIPTLLTIGRELVKGKRFDATRRVANAQAAAKVHNMREVDELCILEVSGALPDLDNVRKICEDCFMPVTLGGGVRNLSQFRALLACGADKVAINTAAVETPDLITQAANKFGSQAVVVSIDEKLGNVWTHSGRNRTDLKVLDWAREVESRGAGEILLTSIDHEGMLEGYDVMLVQKVAKNVEIPVIAHGGCGTYEHMDEVLKHTQAHAVAAGAMFQFTEATPLGAARYLADLGYPMRIAA